MGARGGRLGLAVLVATALLGQDGSALPAWVEQLPECPGRVYALGVADGNAGGEALLRASDRARAAVVARLRATVQGRTLRASHAWESRRSEDLAARAGADQQVRDEVRVEVRAEDLAGLVVDRTYRDSALGTVYALAYLDLNQTEAALATRLAEIRERGDQAVPLEALKARWRFRKLQGDLDRLEDTLALLAPVGAGQSLFPALQAERTELRRRLDTLEQQPIPPLNWAQATMGIRTNGTLPLGLEAYLQTQIERWAGMRYQEVAPDFILDLTFTGNAGGPPGGTVIVTETDAHQGVVYRLDAQLTLLDGAGTPISHAIPIQIIQRESPEGMIAQFCRQLERWLPKLVGEAHAQLQ